LDRLLLSVHSSPFTVHWFRAIGLFHSNRSRCKIRTRQIAGTVEAETEANQPSRAESRAPIRIIGVACGVGAPDPRCAEGPTALRRGGLISRLQHAGLAAAWSTTLPATSGADAYTVVARVAERLALHTEALAAAGRIPVVLGGDHTCAIGTWKGIARAVAPRGSLGLIWIDAHMDAHIPQTTPSGRLHGMPLACLLGHGDPRLTAIAAGTLLDPKRVCLVGVRSFETGEAALLRRLGVRIFFMHEVARRGLQDVLGDAVAIAGRGGSPYGITLDLDAIDPRDAPGVGTPVAGGIRGPELLRALSRLGRDAMLAGLEIAEYNPDRDRGGKTARLVAATIHALFAPRTLSIVSGPAPCSDRSYAENDKRRRMA
jgi:arginase